MLDDMERTMQENATEHGLFGLNELITTDLASAREFYGRLFGWSFTETRTIYGNPYLVVHKGRHLVGGMMLRQGNVPEDTPLCWDPYVIVDDVDASARQVAELGGKVILPPTDIPGMGRFSVIHDPQGVSLNIITPESAPSS